MSREESKSTDFSRSKRKLIRGPRGRFVSSSPSNKKKTKRVEHQRKHKERRKEVKNQLFHEYLNCFVIQGKGEDSITASRSKGPFSRLFEAIVKEEYRLGPNLRDAGLKLFYSEGGHLRYVNGSTPKLTMNPNEYKGCRLPRTTLGSEMSRVQKWINAVWMEQALLFPSVNDAFQFCKGFLRSLAAKDNSNTAPLLPLAQNKVRNQNPGSHCRLSVSSLTKTVEHSRTAGAQAKVTTTNSGQTASSADSSAHVQGPNASSELAISSPKISELTQTAQEDLRQSRKLHVCLEIARNEQLYTLLHLALDDNLETQFGAYSGVYLKDVYKQGEEPCQLVKEISTYAHWKRYGIPNQFQYDRLERRLKNTAAISDRVRLLTSSEDKPLPLYKDMRWDFMTYC